MCWSMRHTNSLLLGITLMIASLPSAAGTLSLHQALEEIDTLHADFTQTSPGSEPQQGRLWIARPDRFRIEISEPWQQRLVSNGTHFWNYDLDLDQVIIEHLNRDLRQLPILLFSSTEAELNSAFNVETFEDESANWYVLAPKTQANLFRALTLVMQDGLPVSLIVVDATGLRTEVLFRDVVVNEPVADSQFEPVIPDGVDIVDQRTDASGTAP